MTKRTHWQCNWILVGLLLGVVTYATAKQPADFVVAAYLPDYRFYINVNATAPLLTDLILFSIEPNKFGLASGVCCLDESHYQVARAARAYKLEKTGQHLKLWVSVGGAGRSNAFPEIASDPAKGKRFLQNLKSLCIQEELDGVDFNWERPQSQLEHQMYTRFLVDAATVLHEANLLVSVSTNHLIHPTAANLLDRIHMCSYNLASNAYHAEHSKVAEFAEHFVEQYPLNKLVLGLPAYAQNVKNGQMDKTYSEIMDAFLMEQSSDGIDGVETFDGYRFESPKAIRRKVSYVVSEGLKGVFLWELGQDKQLEGAAPGGILLEAAAGKHTKDTTGKSSEEL